MDSLERIDRRRSHRRLRKRHSRFDCGTGFQEIDSGLRESVGVGSTPVHGSLSGLLVMGEVGRDPVDDVLLLAAWEL